jgi:hypothetical protein
MVMGVVPSSLIGAARAVEARAPTRLVRACVVDVRTAILQVGIPRTLVDCIGVTTREPIHGAVILGWSGMQWQSCRPPLTPTTRNIKTGIRFSENPVDRMSEMAYDLDSTGWDGDEVCIGFYGRNAVVLGTFHHRWENYDLEDNVVSRDLEPGRRLQDDPEWDVSNTDKARDVLFTARDSSHPDALPFRWGQIVATFWETRGVVAEIARPNNPSGTLFESWAAVFEFSSQWCRADSRAIRLACLDKDENPDEDEIPQTRHFFLISDGSETGYILPPQDEAVDGFLGVVSDEDQFLYAFAATGKEGGDVSGEKLVSATRYPELREVIDQMQAQIDELQKKLDKAADYMALTVSAIGQIFVSVPAAGKTGTGGLEALSAVGLSDASATIGKDVKPTESSPSQKTLSDARSITFRVGH